MPNGRRRSSWAISDCLLLAFAFSPIAPSPCLSFAMPSGVAAADGPAPLRWLVVDFDGTCTAEDTTPLLPRMASLHAGDDDEERCARLGAFRALEEEFFRAHSEVKDALFAGSGGGGDSLHSALNALDQVSTSVTASVSKSACLAGLPKRPEEVLRILERDGALRSGARLRAGCAEAVARAHEAGWELGVLSINWCPPLIEAVLVGAVRRHLRGGGERGALPAPEIWSNSVDEAGAVRLLIPGASAKRSRIAAIRKSRGRAISEIGAQGGGVKDDPVIVYIGDSSTDLSALLEADVGIMLGRSSTVVSFAERWGIRLAGLAERQTGGAANRGKHQLDARDSNTVWIADNWSQIDGLLREIGDG